MRSILQWRWSHGFDPGGELGDHAGELFAFGGRNPVEHEPVRGDADETQQFFDDGDAFGGHEVALEVVAFADVTAGDKHAIGAHLERFYDMVGRDGAAAHDTDGQDAGRIAPAAAAGQVSAGVAAPVAEESDYGRFEALVGHILGRATAFHVQNGTRWIPVKRFMKSGGIPGAGRPVKLPWLGCVQNVVRCYVPVKPQPPTMLPSGRAQVNVVLRENNRARNS